MDEFEKSHKLIGIKAENKITELQHFHTAKPTHADQKKLQHTTRQTKRLRRTSTINQFKPEAEYRKAHNNYLHKIHKLNNQCI